MKLIGRRIEIAWTCEDGEMIIALEKRVQKHSERGLSVEYDNERHCAPHCARIVDLVASPLGGEIERVRGYSGMTVRAGKSTLGSSVEQIWTDQAAWMTTDEIEALAGPSTPGGKRQWAAIRKAAGKLAKSGNGKSTALQPVKRQAAMREPNVSKKG